MSDKLKVLFVCIHNSARSQMAEAFLKEIAGDKFEVESAGLEPGKLNLMVVEAMKEIGIDISGNTTKNVYDFLRQGKTFDFVFTVCDESQAERCPVFPGGARKIHMGFPDPSSFRGSYEEKLRNTREVRDMIKEKIEEWVDSDV